MNPFDCLEDVQQADRRKRMRLRELEYHVAVKAEDPEAGLDALASRLPT
jgi:hypothetical protein